MKKALRKTISLVLCLAALLGMVVLPVPARAVEEESKGYWQLVRTETSPTPSEVNDWNSSPNHHNAYFPTMSAGSMSATGSAYDTLLDGTQIEIQTFSVSLSYNAPPERIETDTKLDITFTARTAFQNTDKYHYYHSLEIF